MFYQIMHALRDPHPCLQFLDCATMDFLYMTSFLIYYNNHNDSFLLELGRNVLHLRHPGLSAMHRTFQHTFPDPTPAHWIRTHALATATWAWIELPNRIT